MQKQFILRVISRTDVSYAESFECVGNLLWVSRVSSCPTYAFTFDTKEDAEERVSKLTGCAIEIVEVWQ